MNAQHVAESVLQRLEAAWNAGDGQAFGREYADDAGFVNVHGALVSGRAAIAAGHDQILSTIYAGSTNRMRLVSVEPVTGDVIVARSRHTLEVPAGPLAGIHEALVTAVLVRSTGRWRITASQTTLVNPAQAGDRALAGAR